jgi:hypothetical protein
VVAVPKAIVEPVHIVAHYKPTRQSLQHPAAPSDVIHPGAAHQLHEVAYVEVLRIKHDAKKKPRPLTGRGFFFASCLIRSITTYSKVLMLQ